jgi:hypothetical protein
MKTKIFLVALAVFFTASYIAMATWVEPDPWTKPSDGNVSAPLNVGSVAQTKQGNLATSALGSLISGGVFWANSASYLAVGGGNVGIGMTSPTQKLDIDGQIRIRGGNPDAGRVLTSDVNGVASWQAPSGGLPSGTSGQTLRNNGTSWIANSLIFNNGTRIGINTTSPSSLYMLHVNGDVGALGFYYSSDRSLKKDIAPLKDSLSKIVKMNGVSFKWKETGKESIGLIAQDVEQVFPEAVTGEEGSKSIDYSALVASLIEAVKEQQTEIEWLKKELSQLKEN